MDYFNNVLTTFLGLRIKLPKHLKDRHPDQMKEFKQVSFNLIFNI